MVALLPRGLRRLAVPALEPGQHRLADVDAAIVDQVDFQDAMTAGGEQLAHRPAQQVVADMAQMERLVGVRAGEFHHHGLARCGQLSEIGLRRDFRQIQSPVGPRKLDIEKSLHYIEPVHLRIVLLQPGTDLVRRRFRRLMARLEQRENHEGHIALKLLARRLHLDQPRRRFNLIQRRHATSRRSGNII